MSNSDITEVNSFTSVASRYFSDYGFDLREEAKNQASYYLHMENLPLKLKKALTQSSTISTSVPGSVSLLKDAASLYESFTEFRDYLIVALLNESINITMGNGN